MDKMARAKARRAYFRQRERDQGAHLVKALRGRYQKTFSKPQLEVRKLTRRARWRLNAHNPHSRTLWFTALARELSRQLEGDTHFIQMDRPIYFVTIIDDRQKIIPDRVAYKDWPEWMQREPEPTWRQMRSAYSKALSQCDCIGMLDVAMYVSAKQVFVYNTVYSVHAHALVWNSTEAALKKLFRNLPTPFRANIDYATPIDIKCINAADFLQMVWYVSKMPRKQYQLWRRDSDRLRQFKGNINGVNSVRLYALMADVTLDQLTFSHGEGRDVLARMGKRVARFRTTH